jgi:hypothetical protein
MAKRSLMMCAGHGEQTWEGHAICVPCGRVYNLNDDTPENCQCGAVVADSVRVICPECHKVESARPAPVPPPSWEAVNS